MTAKMTSMLSKLIKNQEQMRLKSGKKLKTTSFNLRFIGSKKEEYTLTCSKIFKPEVTVNK